MCCVSRGDVYQRKLLQCCWAAERLKSSLRIACGRGKSNGRTRSAAEAGRFAAGSRPAQRPPLTPCRQRRPPPGAGAAAARPLAPNAPSGREGEAAPWKRDVSRCRHTQSDRPRRFLGSPRLAWESDDVRHPRAARPSPAAGTGRVPDAAHPDAADPDEGRVMARSYDISLELSRPLKSACHALRTLGRAFPAFLGDREGRDRQQAYSRPLLPAPAPACRPPGPRSPARPPSNSRAFL